MNEFENIIIFFSHNMSVESIQKQRKAQHHRPTDQDSLVRRLNHASDVISLPRAGDREYIFYAAVD